MHAGSVEEDRRRVDGGRSGRASDAVDSRLLVPRQATARSHDDQVDHSLRLLRRSTAADAPLQRHRHPHSPPDPQSLRHSRSLADVILNHFVGEIKNCNLVSTILLCRSAG